MFVPYNVDVPMQRWPIANWALIAATTLLTFIFWSDPEGYATVFVLFRGEHFHALQLVGNLFGHADIFHLAGNMFFLFVFGNAINAKLGHLPFLLLYFGLGLAESLIWLAVDDGFATLGASGAIMGIIGVFLVLYPANDVQVFYWFGIIAAGSVSISSYWIILMYIGFDLLGLVMGGDTGTNYIAHFVGTACGFGIAMGLVTSGLVKPEAGERTLVDLWKGAGKKARGQQDRAEYHAPRASAARPTTQRELDLSPIALEGDAPPPAPKPSRPAMPPRSDTKPSTPRPAPPGGKPQPPRPPRPPAPPRA